MEYRALFLSECNGNMAILQYAGIISLSAALSFTWLIKEFEITGYPSPGTIIVLGALVFMVDQEGRPSPDYWVRFQFF